MGLALLSGMTIVRQPPARPVRLWLMEPEDAVPTNRGRRWDFASPAALRRNRRNGGKSGPPRLRVLRVAPRLSVVTGDRKDACRATTAAHFSRPTETMGFDPDDAPSCA